MLANPRKFYHSFTIPKKSGGTRQIDAPQKSLKLLQSALVPVFEDMLAVSPDAYGFLPGRSIVDNARVHQGQDTVLNVDIQGFFPSISTGRLTTVFRQAQEVEVSAYMARSLARLCTLDGALPQGSPASPVLTNLVSVRLDARLAGLARAIRMPLFAVCGRHQFFGDGTQGVGATAPALWRPFSSEKALA